MCLPGRSSGWSSGASISGNSESLGINAFRNPCIRGRCNNKMSVLSLWGSSSLEGKQVLTTHYNWTMADFENSIQKDSVLRKDPGDRLRAHPLAHAELGYPIPRGGTLTDDPVNSISNCLVSVFSNHLNIHYHSPDDSQKNNFYIFVPLHTCTHICMYIHTYTHICKWRFM